MLLMVGCQPLQPALRSDPLPFEEVPPIEAGQTLMITADGTYRVVLDFPEDPPENQELEVTGIVYDSEGPIGDDVEVYFDAGMPHHGHGLAIDVETRRAPAGRFVTPGVRFHMKGRWLLTCDVTRGAHLERARAWIMVN